MPLFCTSVSVTRIQNFDVALAVRQMLDEVTGLRQVMTLWADIKSHMLASYRTCFLNILKV